MKRMGNQLKTLVLAAVLMSVAPPTTAWSDSDGTAWKQMLVERALASTVVCGSQATDAVVATQAPTPYFGYAIIDCGVETRAILDAAAHLKLYAASGAPNFSAYMHDQAAQRDFYRARPTSVGAALVIIRAAATPREPANLEGCEPGKLAPPRWSSASRAAGGRASDVLFKVESLIRGSGACDTKVRAIQGVFASAVASELDDYLVLTYFASAWAALARSPQLRQFVGAMSAVHSENDSYDYEDLGNVFEELEPAQELNSPILLLRNAMLGLEAGELARLGISYDGVSGLSASARESLVLALSTRFGQALVDRDARESVAGEFRRACDEKLSRVFGDAEAIAAATGVDVVDAKPTDLGVKYRSHTFLNLHLYPTMLANENDHALFAPPGWTSASAGSMALTQGSYNLAYPRLGRYRGVILNINHLADFDRLLRFSRYAVEKNALGSLRVGSIGGVGGESPPTPGKSYIHSHLQLIRGGKKLNFVDAFCR